MYLGDLGIASMPTNANHLLRLLGYDCLIYNVDSVRISQVFVVNMSFEPRGIDLKLFLLKQCFQVFEIQTRTINQL